MTEHNLPVRTGYLNQKPLGISKPLWTRCEGHYAQNLLEISDEPIEYDHDDEDYKDNCFFFPDDCSWSPPKDWTIGGTSSETLHEVTDIDEIEHDTMVPGLPDIKMLDTEALSGLLEDNLSPPEITTIL